MEKYYTAILNIRNKDYLKMLKTISLYYKYGKKEGDKLLKLGKMDILELEDIDRFISEYIAANKILLDYFFSKGLKFDSKIIEFVPSSLLSFQNISELTNITSIIKYRIDIDEFGKYYVGTLKKSGLNIHDNFSYDVTDYDTVLNNSIIDILKIFNGEHDFITDVHGVKFAESNNLDFFSGYAIRNSSPLREYVIEDFIKSVDKTNVPCESVIFEEKGEYTLGMIKRNKDEL